MITSPLYNTMLKMYGKCVLISFNLTNKIVKPDPIQSKSYENAFS